MRRTDSTSCCVVEPKFATSAEIDNGGVEAGSGGAAGGEVEEAFAAERRSLSSFFPDGSFGAALTAVN
jgi:hypothetical protein